MILYEERVVLFIDILGFRNIVNTTIRNGAEEEDKTDNILKALDFIASFNDEDFDWCKSRKVTQFSDSIVVSFLLSEQGAISNILMHIKEMICNLAHFGGLLLRGGVSFGKLYHDNNIVFGPAMIEAYDMESKAALYPRVILDITLVEQAIKNRPEDDQAFEVVNLFHSEITEDQDGMLYVDYISKSDVNGIETHQYIAKLRDIIITGLSINKIDIKVKYGWLKAKFNEFLVEQKESVFASDYEKVDLIED